MMRKINTLATVLVGGGSIFSSSVPPTGSASSIALSLVPSGLTPVAFFPPTPTQTLPATSVIFLEAQMKKRKKRYSEHNKEGNSHNNNIHLNLQVDFYFIYLFVLIIFKIVMRLVNVFFLF